MVITVVPNNERQLHLNWSNNRRRQAIWEIGIDPGTGKYLCPVCRCPHTWYVEEPATEFWTEDPSTVPCNACEGVSRHHWPSDGRATLRARCRRVLYLMWRLRKGLKVFDNRTIDSGSLWLAGALTDREASARSASTPDDDASGSRVDP